MNCILLACYLPYMSKKYVIDEIFEYFKVKDKSAKIFVGIQSNSIPETEKVIRQCKGNLKVETIRVKPEMMIDSDASSFLAALELYKNSNKNFDLCYFVHTKGITSNTETLRKLLFNEIFDANIANHVLTHENVGSYGPFMTITNVQEDISKMSCLTKFSNTFTHEIIECYYVYTFYMIKNSILKYFTNTVDLNFFNIPIQSYSDRYFFERDFHHICDMLGYEPLFKYLHGNYNMNFTVPSIDDYMTKVNKWKCVK